MVAAAEDGDVIAAVRAGSVADVAKLLEAGANPNAHDVESTLYALMLAAGMGATEIVRQLIGAGAAVNLLDGRAGSTALHKACQGGHLDVVLSLLEAGAWVNVQAATTGHTPLVEAIWFAADDIVEALLQRDARIELHTYYGFTIDDHINYALKVNTGANHDRLLRIHEQVEERRAADDLKSQGILNAAVLKGDLPAVQRAIVSGANLEERYPIIGSFSDGHTPLLIAARDGHGDIVETLIAAGADVNAIDLIFGAVPLHKATYHGYEEITRSLAKARGVNLDYQGPSNGYAPLHDSLWHGYADCAQVLLAAGARVDVVAYDGKLPIDIAREQFGPSAAIVEELKKRESTSRQTEMPRSAFPD